MLKHQEIIDKMTDREKIAFLCNINSLSERRCKELGISKLKLGDMKKAFESRYLALSALSNSFDPELAEELAGRVFSKLSADHSSHALIPGPKPSLDPFRSGISEDIFLSKAFSRAFLRAADDNGITSVVTGYGISNEESEWVDKEPNERFLREVLVAPYAETVNDGGCSIYLSEQDPESKNYRASAMDMADIAEKEGKICVCRKVSSESTALYVQNEKMFLEGSEIALEGAFLRYKQVKRYIEQGKSTTEELASECERGIAVSPEKLDKAVSAMIELRAHSKSGKEEHYSVKDDELILRAVRESAVLLKNEGELLPLKAETKVCVIGDIAFEERDGVTLEGKLSQWLSELGYLYLGSERGYVLEDESDMSELEKAIELTGNADAVILLLGYSEKAKKDIYQKKKLALPVNQQALLDALKEQKNKIAAVVPSEICPDIVIDEGCAALLALPFETKATGQALCELLTGVSCPCGKLANTVYTNSRDLYKNHLRYGHVDGIKRGSFFGYRYYDTAGADVGYPFGHGLSYTEFKYSDLKIEDGRVIFTVKNVGNRFGTETAQIYAGVENGKVIRPKKELCGFARIELMPGEAKTVSVSVELPKVYEAITKSMVTEKGRYVISVGSSVKDVRLTGHIDAGNYETENECREEYCDYIQSETNIFKYEFGLEAKSEPMKRSVLNIVTGAAALCLGICLKLYCVVTDLNAGFFDAFSLILAAAGMVFFVIEAINKNRSDIEERAELDKKTDEMFDQAEQLPFYAADKMFLNEFRAEEETSEAEEDVSDISDELIEKYVDKELTFEEAANDFAKYAEEKGFIFRIETVRSIFAAISASRLIVMDGLDSERFKEFLTLLSGYFGSKAYIDTVNKDYKSADSLFFKKDSNGERERTQLRAAFDSARNASQSLCFAALDGVEFQALPSYFAPFAEYIKSPAEQHRISAYTIHLEETSYTVPKNLWLILNISETERLSGISDFVSELGSVIAVYFEKCAAVEQVSEYRAFTYYQMEYLTERAASQKSFDEENWKKIDRLEEYVNARVPYSIGNRQWLNVERYLFSYLALGGEEADALDSAVSARIIPQILAVLKDKLGYEDKTVLESVEEIFGDEHSESCKRMIRISEAKKAE